MCMPQNLSNGNVPAGWPRCARSALRGTLALPVRVAAARVWLMAKRPRVLGIVLAGGEGKRLWPLTADRAKPAVPFGGNFRLVDFVLSNLVNAGYLRSMRAHPVQVPLAG